MAIGVEGAGIADVVGEKMKERRQGCALCTKCGAPAAPSPSIAAASAMRFGWMVSLNVSSRPIQSSNIAAASFHH